jgi:serine/threonine-protein kinase RsbW
MGRFRFTIESNLSDVFLVSVVIRGVCDRLGVNPAEASLVDVSAVEAVTNVIKHAYLGTPGHEVTVEVLSAGERLDLYVRDQGQSMPGEQVARLRYGSNALEFDPHDLGRVPEGGMGLQIIHQIMDETDYTTEAGTNCLRLTKFLHRSESREAWA